MKIAIVGIGKMGYQLIRMLSEEEGHSITVIDWNLEALEFSQNTQDVSCVHGNGLDIDVLKEADISSCEMVIATMSADETNILCCQLARQLGVKYTIARVRSPELSKSVSFFRDDVGISMSVNPEYSTAAEIRRLLQLPSAAKVDVFARGRVELAECRIGEGNKLAGMAINSIPKKFKTNVLICAVQRNSETIIPNGSFVLEQGDRISVTAPHSSIASFFSAAGFPMQKIKNVMIIGGSKICIYLAQMLVDFGINVKIIEKDEKRCQYISDLIPQSMTICGDGTDEELLREEGIETTDAVVSLSGYDEQNIVIALYSELIKVKRVIAKINHISFSPLLKKIGIETLVLPQIIAADRVLSFVRATQNSLGSQIESLSKIVDNTAEAIEFNVNETFTGCGVPLRDLQLKSGLLIACITRGNSIIFPMGNDTIEIGDNVIIITSGLGFNDINNILRKD